MALDLMAGGYAADGPGWDAAQQAVRTAAAGADDYADLHAALADAVRVAGGGHSVLLTPDEAAASQEA
ncbi:hypothetical protein GUG51_13685, partial [Xanthomonas citri pv. citri]|nr:hypothetical protein [Xanthomonas citri pv. citri]